jgi:hypothetical protein
MTREQIVAEIFDALDEQSVHHPQASHETWARAIMEKLEAAGALLIDGRADV